MNLFRHIMRLGLTVLVIWAFSVTPGHAFSLEECVELALKNNPDLQKQELNLDLAHEDMSDQKSQNFGKLNFVSSYTHFNLPRTLAPLTPASIFSDPMAVPTTQDLFTAGVVYEVPLFTGFAQTRAVEIAALQKEMAGAAVRLNREQLIYNVRTLYVNILSLQSQEEAQTSYVRSLEGLYEDVTRQVKLGKKAKVDLLKATADLRNAQAVRSRISANIRIVKASLASLLNVDTIPELEPVDLSPDSIVTVDNGLTGRIDDLERLRVARLALDKNSKLVEKTKGALYPQVVLNASYGQNFGPNDKTNRYSGDWENQDVWQAAVNLRWNIFDFGGSRARVQKARILERQSRYEQKKTELELKRALEEAVTKINTAVTDYRSARAELAMTRETESIEQIRFDQGAADINDLLYAKARNQLARSRFIGAAYSYKNARFYLDYLLEKGDKR